ncbi:MAG: hypothetical protein JST04_05965 [Bdellovibrionales bacterium]|nr:hypothetical protein [Bdellovibrionales bacterium]
MSILNRVPKIEKKHLIAGGALTAVAVVAFVLGTLKSGTPVAKTEHGPATKVAVAKPAHEPDEGKSSAPVGEHASPNRAPAAAPAKDDKSDDGGDYYEEEEEIDTQIAHRLPHGKKIFAKDEKKSEAKPETVHGHESVADKTDVVVETESSPAPKEERRGIFARLFGVYADAWESLNLKVHAIQQAEEENKKLKLENAYLRVMVETGKYTARSDEAKAKTETVGKKLATTAGSRAARSIASIRYQFPENLLPEQLLALGVGYFKVKDDEKAAVILNFLTELEDDHSFRTAPNYLMAGIAFYRLEHYKNAGEYFERIGKLTETDPETQKAKRQAVYWQALVAERTKNRGLAQKLMLDSLEQDPQTKEARWVNPQGESDKRLAPTRMPASLNPDATEPETEVSHDGEAPNHE